MIALGLLLAQVVNAWPQKMKPSFDGHASDQARAWQFLAPQAEVSYDLILAASLMMTALSAMPCKRSV